MIRLLCTDLDRTLIPNGPQAEPVGARDRLAERVHKDDLPLAYVTGRDEMRVREAIRTWSLPRPDFVLADAGTSFFVVEGARWILDQAWDTRQRQVWGGRDSAGLQSILDDIDALNIQAADRQRPFKRSYTVPRNTDIDALRGEIDARLARIDMQATSLASHDPLTDEALLDVVSPVATKAGAIAELAARLGLRHDEVLFAGDSGNDLDALTGGFRSVLVGNADDTTRQLARTAVSANETQALYFEAVHAYAAGILEGLNHFTRVSSTDD